MANVLLARMGEITLKGLNRGSFEIQLKCNLKYRLKKFGDLKIYQSQSRIWIEPKEEDNPNFQSMAAAQDIMKAVCQVFGIVSVSLARKFEGDFESVKENAFICVEELLENNPDFKTFKVESKRGNKTFPMTSPEICEELGYQILQKFPNLTDDGSQRSSGRILCKGHAPFVRRYRQPCCRLHDGFTRYAARCRIFPFVSLYE